MKGFKKWFIGFLTLLGLFVPSLLTSSDVSALKYSFNTFPLYQARYDDLSATSGDTFSFWFDSPSVSSFKSSLFDTSSSYRYSRHIVNDVCQDYEKHSIFTNTYVESRHYREVWSGEGNGFYRYLSENPPCNYNVVNYSYDSFYGLEYNLSTGDVAQVVNIDVALFDDSSYSDVRSLKRVTVPLNFTSDTVIPASTPLSFSFGLVTGNTLGFDNFTTPNVSFTYKYSSSGVVYTNSDVSPTCSVDSDYGYLIVNDDLSVSGSFSGFLVTCSFTPSHEVHHFVSTLSIYGGVDYNPTTFLTYHGGDANGLYFSGSYLVSDNDDTWSGITISPTPTGNNLESAPGYTQLYGYGEYNPCGRGDYVNCFLSMFNFNFTHPFAPIFALFTHGTGCANIPTIANMLNATETQYCSWFPSSIRNVLTPVFGLSSMMLLFGFLVRWLGSSSGNMFEDSGHIQSPGVSRVGDSVKSHGWRRTR